MDSFMNVVEYLLSLSPTVRKLRQAGRPHHDTAVRHRVEQVCPLVVADDPEIDPFLLGVFREKRLGGAPRFRVRDRGGCREHRLIIRVQILKDQIPLSLRLIIKDLGCTCIPSLSPNHFEFMPARRLQAGQSFCGNIASGIFLFAPGRVKYMPLPLIKYHGWILYGNLIKGTLRTWQHDQ